jgi:hypothetical protein
MIRRWWRRYFYGVGAGPYLERCPFCGETFDIRDSCQVLVHYKHQVTAGISLVRPRRWLTLSSLLPSLAPDWRA